MNTWGCVVVTPPSNTNAATPQGENKITSPQASEAAVGSSPTMALLRHWLGVTPLPSASPLAKGGTCPRLASVSSWPSHSSLRSSVPHHHFVVVASTLAIGEGGHRWGCLASLHSPSGYDKRSAAAPPLCPGFSGKRCSNGQHSPSPLAFLRGERDSGLTFRHSYATIAGR